MTMPMEMQMMTAVTIPAMSAMSCCPFVGSLRDCIVLFDTSVMCGVVSVVVSTDVVVSSVVVVGKQARFSSFGGQFIERV